MFRNAKMGDKVWDFIYGWGNIISVIKDHPFPIAVDFSNGKTIYYKFNGNYNETDINPRLFWDEIKFEIPEKPFDLEKELRKLEIVEFESGIDNYTLLWSGSHNTIIYDYYINCQNPLAVYFTRKSINDFVKKIENKRITKEEFFKAYKNVFGGK